MASILIGAGAFASMQIKKSRQKKKEKSLETKLRFAELERDNATRIAQLQQNTCFCQRSDWRGGGCPNHGYVPPAPDYTENAEEDVHAASRVRDVSDEGRGERDAVPAYEDASALPSDSPVGDTGTRAPSHPYQYRRGEEEGAFVEYKEAPPSMGDEEIRRINEERRKRMKTGRFTNFLLRRKG